MDNNVETTDLVKLLASSKDDLDGIYDEKARAQYAAAIATIYEANVKERELNQQAQKTTFENKLKEEQLKAEKSKDRGELIVKALDVGLKFVGTAAGIVVSAGLYRQCWNEGMEFEKTGIITSKRFQDHIRSLKLKFW